MTKAQKSTDRYLHLQIGNLLRRHRSTGKSAPTEYRDDGQEMDRSDSDEWAYGKDADKAVAQAITENDDCLHLAMKCINQDLMKIFLT